MQFGGHGVEKHRRGPRFGLGGAEGRRAARGMMEHGRGLLRARLRDENPGRDGDDDKGPQGLGERRKRRNESNGLQAGTSVVPILSESGA